MDTRIRVAEVRRGQGPLPDLKILSALRVGIYGWRNERKWEQGQLSKRENLPGELIIELLPFKRNEDYIVLMQTQLV